MRYAMSSCRSAAIFALVDVLAAADRYFDANHRRLTFEYVLLGGVNDRLEHAVRLAEVLAGRTALLNVIPYNPVAGLPYSTPSAAMRKTRFVAHLRAAASTSRCAPARGTRSTPPAANCGDRKPSTAGSPRYATLPRT